MSANPTAWPASSGDEFVLRRWLAAFWGAAMVALLVAPIAALPGGPDGSMLDVPAARYWRLVVAAAGVATLLGAATGRRRWGWVTLAAAPLLVGLGLWEHTELAGPWWEAWWRPALGVALIGVPAWLLTGRELGSA